MKGSIVAFAVCASLASAQNFGAEPSCAKPCLSSAIAAAGCALTDEACQCGTAQAAIQTAVTPCLLTACNVSELQIAASVGLGLCSAYSASLAAAKATTTSSSSMSTASMTSTTPSSSMSIASMTTTTPSSSVSTAPMTTTVTAITTSVGLSSSSPTTTKASTTTTAKSNSTVSTTGVPSAISSAGASALMVGVGTVAGLVFGVMAAL